LTSGRYKNKKIQPDETPQRVWTRDIDVMMLIASLTSMASFSQLSSKSKICDVTMHMTTMKHIASIVVQASAICA